jgi:hypothetical protein
VKKLKDLRDLRDHKARPVRKARPEHLVLMGGQVKAGKTARMVPLGCRAPLVPQEFQAPPEHLGHPDPMVRMVHRDLLVQQVDPDLLVSLAAPALQDRRDPTVKTAMMAFLGPQDRPVLPALLGRLDVSLLVKMAKTDRLGRPDLLVHRDQPAAAVPPSRISPKTSGRLADQGHSTSLVCQA